MKDLHLGKLALIVETERCRCTHFRIFVCMLALRPLIGAITSGETVEVRRAGRLAAPFRSVPTRLGLFQFSSESLYYTVLLYDFGLGTPGNVLDTLLDARKRSVHDGHLYVDHARMQMK